VPFSPFGEAAGDSIGLVGDDIVSGPILLPSPITVFTRPEYTIYASERQNIPIKSTTQKIYIVT